MEGGLHLEATVDELSSLLIEDFIRGVKVEIQRQAQTVGMLVLVTMNVLGKHKHVGLKIGPGGSREEEFQHIMQVQVGGR